MLPSIPHYQTPRVSFLWITLTQIVCTLPLVSMLPGWVLILCVACVFWRLMVFQGRWSYPQKYIRYIFVIAAIVGLMLSFPRVVSMQAAVSLLIVTYYLKLLEMFRKKDVYVILVLSYFIVASAFLFREDVVMLLYFLTCMILITVSFVSINRSKHRLNAGGTLYLGFTLVLQATPIALCLFLFFPRFPPFWVLEVKKEGPSVGISETMSPSDIAELGSTGGLAFRVEFDDEVPRTEDLYWRVLTLSQFDGVQWSSLFSTVQAQVYFADAHVQSRVQSGFVPDGQSYSYRLTLEPTENRWLPTLDRPLSMTSESAFMPDFSAVSEHKVTSLISYMGMSMPTGRLNLKISPWSSDRNTRLPSGFNPESKAFAQDLFDKSRGDPNTYIRGVLSYFQESPFFYTLRPGQYGQHSIDEFLFDRRKGFCAHYASAMVFLLRTVGIPARVVIGYHGGEINPIGGHMLVYQYDAHAWVEAWIDGQGWVRFDPTAQVAPWRLLIGVEQMMRQTNSDEVPQLLNDLLRGNEFTNRLRLLLDYTNHRWNKYVVNFDETAQRQMLEEFFETVDLRLMVTLMSLTVGLLLLIFFVFIVARTRAKPLRKEDKLLQLLLDVLARKYQKRPKGCALHAYQQSLETQLKTNEIDAVAKAFDVYRSLAYAPLSDHEKKEMLQSLRYHVFIAIRTLKHIF